MENVRVVDANQAVKHRSFKPEGGSDRLGRRSSPQGLVVKPKFLVVKPEFLAEPRKLPYRLLRALKAPGACGLCQSSPLY